MGPTRRAAQGAFSSFRSEPNPSVGKGHSVGSDWSKGNMRKLLWNSGKASVSWWYWTMCSLLMFVTFILWNFHFHSSYPSVPQHHTWNQDSRFNTKNRRRLSHHWESQMSPGRGSSHVSDLGSDSPRVWRAVQASYAEKQVVGEKDGLIDEFLVSFAKSKTADCSI